MKIVLVLLAILICLPIVKRLLVQVLAPIFAGAAGRVALDQQPDLITLSPAEAESWRSAAAARALAAPLIEHGFEDAGTYRINEMPGVLVQLLAKPAESFYAAIYEHPQAGHWIDVVTRYQNGDGVTFTTARPTGLESAPGHTTVNAPGTPALALYTRARAERPPGKLKPALTESAAYDFMASYAEETAWRKGKAISASEVAAVARRAA